MTRFSRFMSGACVKVGFAMREMRQSFVQYRKDDGHQEKPPVLFILDEFPQLAYMPPY